MGIQVRITTLNQRVGNFDFPKNPISLASQDPLQVSLADTLKQDFCGMRDKQVVQMPGYYDLAIDRAPHMPLGARQIVPILAQIFDASINLLRYIRLLPTPTRPVIEFLYPVFPLHKYIHHLPGLDNLQDGDLLTVEYLGPEKDNAECTFSNMFCIMREQEGISSYEKTLREDVQTKTQCIRDIRAKAMQNLLPTAKKALYITLFAICALGALYLYAFRR